MTINPSQFAKECVDATVYCNVYSYLPYVVAVAQLRSQIADTDNGDEIGPFRLIQKDWDAYRSDADFEFNFLSTDIAIWAMQCHVFSLMVYRAQQRLFNANNRNPSAVELYQDQWPQTQPATLVSDLTQALAATQGLLLPAAKAFFGQNIPVEAAPDPNAPPQSAAAGSVNFKKMPNGSLGRQLAQQILDSFEQAGFGSNQQVAALANAIGESNLDPTAHASRGEDSFGLFQLNRRQGLGAGHSPDELLDPASNIAIIINAAKTSKGFVRAASLEDAVAAFVKDVERPSDIPGQTRVRIGIARKILA